MAKKEKKAAAVAEKKDEGAAPLPAIGAASGPSLHSAEAVGGPSVSKATTLVEAHGLDAASEGASKGRKPKGAVLVKSRAPRYTAAGRTFNSAGTVIQPDALTDEQWAVIGGNPQLVITKASGSDADY